MLGEGIGLVDELDRRSLVDGWSAAYLTRVRALGDFVATELPVAAFRRASSTVARACRLAASDRDFVRRVLALTLLAYVLGLPPSSSSSAN